MAEASGVIIPVVGMFDGLSIGRPDAFFTNSYYINDLGGGGAGQRTVEMRDKINRSRKKKDSPQTQTQSEKDKQTLTTSFYTVGLLFVSAGIFLSLVSWYNVLLSWMDSMFVSSMISAVTRSRLYAALIVTGIAIVIIVTAVCIWYFIARYQ